MEFPQKYLEARYGDTWKGMVRLFWATNLYPVGLPASVKDRLREIKESHGELWLGMADGWADDDLLMIILRNHWGYPSIK